MLIWLKKWLMEVSLLVYSRHSLTLKGSFIYFLLWECESCSCAILVNLTSFRSYIELILPSWITNVTSRNPINLRQTAVTSILGNPQLQKTLDLLALSVINFRAHFPEWMALLLVLRSSHDAFGNSAAFSGNTWDLSRALSELLTWW